MTNLNAGFYIDEIHKVLLEHIGKEDIIEFYKDNISFSIKNPPTFINQDEVPPLLKVAWNIIVRGEPTRASLKLSSYILKTHISENIKFEFFKSEVKANLNELGKIESNDLLYLLNNFKTIDEGSVAELGVTIYSIYLCLKKSILYGQLQQTVLILLMANPAKSYLKITGISPEEVLLLQDDLNELFTVLNELSRPSEAKIPLLVSENEDYESELVISVNEDVDNVASLIQNSSNHKSSLNFKFLTDRQIKYRKLGEIIVSEVEKDNGERTEKRDFVFKNDKVKTSLNYILNNVFRKTSFRPGQEAILNRALVGKDVIGLLPTGGGKSLTFQICGLLHPGVTLVVDPINSLMKDQYDKLLDNGISNVSFINSFNTKDERNQRMQLLVEGQFLFLFVSPERFQMENFRSSLSTCENLGIYFSYAVIDEAHCVSEWGHDFRHVYLNLSNNLKKHCKSKSGDISIIGLTATASFDVLADVQREIGLRDDAIVTLPPEAIDRKELNYSILPVSGNVNEGKEFFDRERQIGKLKYPLIKNLLKRMPEKIANLEKKYGYLTKNTDFYKNENGRFRNAGVVFCPTKSVKLPNGVLHLAYGYNNSGGGIADLPFIELKTFFGGADLDTVQDSFVETQAKESYENQEQFINNKANLMIATKAFGMGIDKPNIRFSIHYTFPNSIESFYQEAGRSGRDGNPSLCSIVYHPVDLEANYDFYQNSFKGSERERLIIDELLNEVQYEDNFNLGVLENQIRDQYPEVSSVKLYNDRYIYINGPWRKDENERVKIGLLDLARGLRSYDNATQNFEESLASTILEYARSLLIESSPDSDYLKWLKLKSADGIKTLIDSEKQDSYILKIGFTNGVISTINEKIVEGGFPDFNERIIRAAYNFSSDKYDFLENLKYQYFKYGQTTGVLNNKFSPSEEVKQFIEDSYLKIRNSHDTQRAVYRLNILGIVDDYVIDYVGEVIEVRFKAKSDKEYKKNLKNYLRRYLGIETTRQWCNKADDINDDSVLIKILYVLIDFIESEISEKRKRSIDYMKELCEVYLEEGEQAFRDRMIRYFTSKYARVDYLPADTEKGTKENCAVVVKYINYIDNPPDGLGGQIDNAKHLRGACDNLRINMVENASIDLLTSFSLLALELREEDTIESASSKVLVERAISLYRTGFRRMLRIEPWEEVKSLIILFNHKVLDFNSEIESLMENLSSELLVNRTAFRLKQLNDKISAQ